ncbi:MAG: NAD(P)-dependent oxidoreductase [Deltaproteobacteria bacterium]|nr:MAG: NAD(P)-dependent oxidoreductase [Deltaproteobacteria bacterium]
MRIAITGGTGFIGGHLARNLIQKGHKVNIISRGADKRDTSIRKLAGATFFSIGINDVDKLADAFSGCDGIAHCAGINREIGNQTYQKVHIEGTQNVIDAAKLANVTRVLLISFLNARPNCGSAYHESKWQAEEIVRNSGLDYTVIKKPGSPMALETTCSII